VENKVKMVGGRLINPDRKEVQQKLRTVKGGGLRHIGKALGTERER